MKTAYFFLASVLVLGLGACSDDDDTTPAATGGASSGGSGGAASGGTGATSSGGTGGAAIVDACVGKEAELTAAIDADPDGLFDLAGDCGRETCISHLGQPGLRPCVAECLAADVPSLPSDCLNCVAITVEIAGSAACIGKCLVDQDTCGPNADESCCTKCLCDEGAFEQQSTCMGVASTTDCTVYDEP